MIPVSDVLTLIFMPADDIVKALPRKSRPRPEPILSEGEMVTLLLLKELCGVKRDREWRRFVCRYRSSYFPDLPSWGRFCRRAQACLALTETVRQRLVDRLEHALAERGEATEPRRVDSTGLEAGSESGQEPDRGGVDAGGAAGVQRVAAAHRECDKMLKEHMNLEDIFVRSTEGFFVWVHRKVTALTLGMWVSLCLGREILHVKELLA